MDDAVAGNKKPAPNKGSALIGEKRLITCEYGTRPKVVSCFTIHKMHYT